MANTAPPPLDLPPEFIRLNRADGAWLRGLPELAFEREKISSYGKLVAGVVDDAEIHAEVQRQRLVPPDVFGNGLADAALNELAQGV